MTFFFPDSSAIQPGDVVFVTPLNNLDNSSLELALSIKTRFVLISHGQDGNMPRFKKR
jgi:hypothetical protein